MMEDGNAAGKTTVVAALSFMKAAVLGGSLPQGAIRDCCRCGKGHKNEETVFDIQFQIDGQAYDYGFGCLLADLKITSEWLHALGAESKLLFQRDEAESMECTGMEDGASDSDRMRLDVYRDDFLHKEASGLGSDLFLSAMNAGRSFPQESPLSAFHRAMRWFAEGVDVIGAGQVPATTEYYADGSSLDKVAQVLALLDTGITGLEKQRLSMDEPENYMPPEALLTLRQFLKASASQTPDGKLSATFRSDNAFLGIDLKGSEEPRATVLKIRHEDSLYDFGFQDESDGTKRLFDLMDFLLTHSHEKAFVIDELSRSFHPMLTQQLVKLFNEVHAEDGCQLIFTTHEDAIMSYEYFRRDEIWFVERGSDGCTRLYPLDRFAQDGARSDARIGKKYMEGRFGGVPHISGSGALEALSTKPDE